MKLLLPLLSLIALTLLSGAALPLASSEPPSPSAKMTVEGVLKLDQPRLQIVPDPGSALLLGIAGTLVLFRRRLR